MRSSGSSEIFIVEFGVERSKRAVLTAGLRLHHCGKKFTSSELALFKSSGVLRRAFPDLPVFDDLLDRLRLLKLIPAEPIAQSINQYAFNESEQTPLSFRYQQFPIRTRSTPRTTFQRAK